MVITEPNFLIHRQIYSWIKEIWILLGFTIECTENQTNESLMDTIIQIREDVRTLAKESPQLYALSDRIRDVYLKDSGIVLQDM